MTAQPTGEQWLSTAPDLSVESTTPAHTQIEQWIIGVLGRGELRVGDQLPREDELASALGVSRMTLRQALASLQSAGLIARRTGRQGGTFVTEPSINCDLTGLAGFTEQMRRANVRAGARLISVQTISASKDIAEALSITRQDQVHEIVRVRTANRIPLALERSYFPADQFPDLTSHGLSGSLYSLLTRQYGQRPHTADEVLIPVVASIEEASLLGVDPATPLLLIERTAFTAAGLAVEFARDLFRPDRVRVSLRTGL